MPIVHYVHRPKRPPRKRKAVGLEVQPIVTTTSKRRRVSSRIDTSAGATATAAPAKASNRIEADPHDRQLEPPANGAHRSAVVTTRRLGTATIPAGLLADTPEEHRRRGDAADALWREMVRRATDKR